MSRHTTLPPTRRTAPGGPIDPRRLLTGRFSSIWLITLLLFAASPLISPGSLSGSAVLSMLPFAAVMAIAALGQTLVVSQGGIDLSVPGVMALAAVLATKLPTVTSVPVWAAVAMGIAVGAVSGLVIGIAVVRLSIAAFVASLAVNSILIGVVLQVSKGFPASAAPGLSAFAVGSVWGVPNLLLVAVVVVTFAHWGVRHTVLGRRFVAVGAGRPAARLLGLPTGSYEAGAYVTAGICYSLAGVLLAGYLRTPDILLGNTYLLPTIAAVVLGGSLLSGGITSLAATAVAALFLTQLDQVVLAAGASTATQLLVQAGVLALSVVFRGVPWGTVRTRLRTRSPATRSMPSSP
ncbi:ABC transporter permease [Streptosporangium sp. NPDC000563]|uniref:ABC transporter permease n=1 Tax=unclassified Streptosporangium TaxID=2632669 RepID=UPI0033246EE6